MKAVFHEEALAEMLESASYYENRSEGLGLDFLNAVEQAAQRILNQPNAGTRVYDDIRRRLVAGCPFALLYSIETDLIFTVAVMHQRRRPGYWRQRVNS